MCLCEQIHRSGENYTYDELHEMLRDLQAVDPSFADAYAEELRAKFHRRVVYQDNQVMVLDTFLDGASPSRCFVFNDRLHLVQSEMQLSNDGETLDPGVLMLDVHQVMSSALDWLSSRKPTQWKIGVIGAGGGALVRYLLATRGDAVASIDAVEPNSKVNEVARRFFGTSAEQLPIMTLHEEYGEDFMARQLQDPATHGLYDLLFIDVEAGSPGDGILAPPLSMLTQEFLSGVHALTSSVGMVAINVITDDSEAQGRVATLIKDAIAPETTALFVTLPRNTVIFLIKNAPSMNELQRLTGGFELHQMSELLL
jgi:hypothetical protein